MSFLGDIGKSVFGGKASMPSPGEAQKQAAKGAIQNWPYITQLGNLYNQYQNQAAVSPFLANYPGWQQNWNQLTGNAAQLGQGNIPTDVTNNLQRMMAERGQTIGGSPGTPNFEAALNSALGRDSLMNMQLGLQNTSALMGMMPQQPLFNPGSFVLTPEQQQKMQYSQNQANAQPDPMLSYLNNYIMTVGGNIGGMYAGKAMGLGNMGSGLGSAGTSAAISGGMGGGVGQTGPASGIGYDKYGGGSISSGDYMPPIAVTPEAGAGGVMDYSAYGVDPVEQQAMAEALGLTDDWEMNF